MIYHNDQPDDVRCCVCLSEYALVELQKAKLKECPICKTKVPYMKIKQDILVKLNWQDIRMLAIYSQRWAAGFDQEGDKHAIYALSNILAKLAGYKPEGGTTFENDPYAENLKEHSKPVGVKSPYFKKL
jgi:hypothetical protein